MVSKKMVMVFLLLGVLFIYGSEGGQTTSTLQGAYANCFGDNQQMVSAGFEGYAPVSSEDNPYEPGEEIDITVVFESYYTEDIDSGNVKARLIDNAPADLKPELIGFYIDNFDLEPVRLREFYEQGKVKHLIEWNPKEQDYSGKIRSIEGMSLEQIGLLALQNKRPSKAFALDMAPYEMIDFLTPMGAVDWETATQQTKELLTELGFNVNHKEWDKWKKEWDEE